MAEQTQTAAVEADHLRLIETFTTAWEAGDLDALMALMADNCMFHASVGPEPGLSFVGRDAVRRGFAQFLAAPAAAAPPTDIENAEPLVHRDFAVTRWTVRGAGPNGAPLVRGCDIFEFDGDRIMRKDTYRKVLSTSSQATNP